MHVTQRGHSRSAVFVHSADYLFYLECMAQAVPEVGIDIHAYVLMTNHVHLLVTPRVDDGVARLMQCLGRRYVRYFNTHQQRTGSLWEGRFRAGAIDSETHLFACMRYIEMNPVRAGVTSAPAHYPWSSFRANALGEPNAIVRPHPVFATLGPTDPARRDGYRALFASPLPDDVVHSLRKGVRAWRQRNVPNNVPNSRPSGART